MEIQYGSGGQGRFAEIIDLADYDVLDIMQSRSVEQEVLNLLDETTTRQ